MQRHRNLGLCTTKNTFLPRGRQYKTWFLWLSTGAFVFYAGMYFYSGTVIRYECLPGVTNTLKVSAWSRKQNNSVSKNAECFDSPYVLCVLEESLKQSVVYDYLENGTNNNNDNTGTQQSKSWINEKLNKYRDGKASSLIGNADQTIPIITTLGKKNTQTHAFSTFRFEACPMMCKYKPSSYIPRAKGVIVDGRHVTESDFPDETRPPGQLYFMHDLESPKHFLGSILTENFKYKNWINFAMTYRVDANFPTFYGSLCLNGGPKKTREEFRQLYKSKTRTAAWFVSNCNTVSQRMEFVKELKKHIDVDIYGKCGNESFSEFGTERDFLTTNYKFYLAFENSFCTDYVTEKFFKLFEPHTYIVPVVRGGMDYDRYFPPKTFINAAWFDNSPLELAKYLKEVGADFDKYVGFLESRDKYVIQPFEYRNQKKLCGVCTLLHEGGDQVGMRYSDIGQWLQKDMCFSPEDFIEIHKKRYPEGLPRAP